MLHIYGLVRDCSNSIANALELLQSCTKPLICIHELGGHGGMEPSAYMILINTMHINMYWDGTTRIGSFHVDEPLLYLFNVSQFTIESPFSQGHMKAI